MTSIPRKNATAGTDSDGASDTSAASAASSTAEQPASDLNPSTEPATGALPSEDAGEILGELEREFVLLSRLLIAIRSKFRYEIERAHYVILVLLEDKGPLPIGTIAQTLLLDNSTASRQITAMVRMGLAERSDDPADQRRSIVQSTDKGRKMVSEMRGSRIRDTEFIMSDWNEEDRECFARLLKRYNCTLIRKLSGNESQWHFEAPDDA